MTGAAYAVSRIEPIGVRTVRIFINGPADTQVTFARVITQIAIPTGITYTGAGVFTA